MKNLIMGVAKGYGWDILEPFVTSAIKNCPSAEVILFVDDISAFTRERLQRFEKVICVDIPAEYKNILIIHSRWKICADFLERYGANYAQVFITDTRDVIFQSDIFEEFKNYPNYFGYATEKLSIGEDKICNYIWVESCLGKAMADKLSDKIIICCGTIIGTVNEMKTFCRLMWENLKGEMIWGHEQAMMNYLVYENLLPIENLIEIGMDSGKIFTMAYAKNFFIRDNEIFCGNGKCPAVVHQYDRYNETINFVDEFYHDKNFDIDYRFADMRSVIEQATYLLFMKRIGDAAKFFMKKFLVTEDFSGCVGALLRLWETVMKNPISQASELMELSVQSALKSFKTFGLPLDKICILLNRARECRHPIDPEFKNCITIKLLDIAKEKFASGKHKQYLLYLELIISIEGGRVDWQRN